MTEQSKETVNFKDDNKPILNEEAKKRRVDLDQIEIKKVQADLFERYIYDTGIDTAFKLIFSELITKKIPVENYYTYTASRLRQFGRDLEEGIAKAKK